jgi:hypothetical protein
MSLYKEGTPSPSLVQEGLSPPPPATSQNVVNLEKKLKEGRAPEKGTIQPTER